MNFSADSVTGSGTLFREGAESATFDLRIGGDNAGRTA